MTFRVHQPEMVALGKLRLADYNPREMSDEELDHLVQSIAAFGFVEPIVARREDLLVIGGHQRVHGARVLMTRENVAAHVIDATKIPVVFVEGFDDARTKILNLALNKISGRWDYAKLSSILLEVGSRPDATLTGFSAGEMEDILALMKAPPIVPPPPMEEPAAAEEHTRRFVFDVEDDAAVVFCIRVLERFGMTGPGDAAVAFVAALRVADKAPKQKVAQAKPRRNGAKERRRST